MSDLTVVIPLHNGARYITRTLEGLAAQTAQPAEVIVIDDASTDGGDAIAESFRLPDGSSPTIVRHERPLGVAVSRNHGAFLARTTWIGFCDNDDVWHPQHVETIFRLAADHPDSGAIGTHAVGFALEEERSDLHGHQRFGLVDHWVADDRLETLATLSLTHGGTVRRLRFEDFQQATCMLTTTACFRRDLYAYAGGNATWSPTLGDWAANATVALLSPIVVVQDAPVFYRVRAASQSHRDEALAWGAFAILLGLRYGCGRDPRPAGLIYRHMLGIGARNGFTAREVLGLALLGGVGSRETAAQMKAILKRSRNRGPAVN